MIPPLSLSNGKNMAKKKKKNQAAWNLKFTYVRTNCLKNLLWVNDKGGQNVKKKKPAHTILVIIEIHLIIIEGFHRTDTLDKYISIIIINLHVICKRNE